MFRFQVDGVSYLVYLLTGIFAASNLFSTVIKAIVDTCLFFISFRIQKNWVFKRESARTPIGGLYMQRKLKMDKDS